MSIGAHPSFLFRTETVTANGTSKDVMTTQRYFAWEATPSYHLNKNIGLGIYYLGSHGLTENLIQFTHFVALRALISNIPLGKKFNFTFIPQVYYLQQDALSGMYWNTILNVSKNQFPIMFSINLSQTIQSEIVGKEFLWGIGLVYNINKLYYRAK